MPRAAPVMAATCVAVKFRVLISNSQNVDGRGSVIDAGDASTGALSQAQLRCTGLAAAGTPLQLPGQLDHLCDASGA
ncbi:hypothetical protein D3C80_1891590 [compost metagenome]